MRQKIYEYEVEGTGSFPYDMLRHDACWPARSEDAAELDDFHMPREKRVRCRRVRLRGFSEPTRERWSSFLWSVDPLSVREWR